MKILLAYPAIPDTFWSFKHILKFIHKKAAHIPLGLITIGAMLPKEWDVKLVDMNVEPLTDEALNWADMVMIGAMVIQKESTADVLSRAKAL